MQQIAFISHVPRSGSTFLARLLDDWTENTVVLPEIQLPTMLLRSINASQNHLSESDFLKCLANDPQLIDLGVNTESLAAMYDSDFSTLLGDTIAEIARQIRTCETPDLIVVKCGTIWRHVGALRKLMPNAKVIGVVRDPRAVAASCLRSHRPYYPDRKMGRGDPWHIASQWRQWCEFHSEQAIENTLVIRYEDLIDKPQITFAEIANWLRCVARNEPSQESNYSVATAEQKIHSRVHRPPDLSRLDAWKTELSTRQVTCIEFASRKSMKQWGYTQISLGVNHLLRIFSQLITGYCQHLWCQVDHLSWRVKRKLGLVRRVSSQSA